MIELQGSTSITTSTRSSARPCWRTSKGAGEDLHVDEAHHAFVVAVLGLGLVAVVVVAGFSVYVTAPLRRMSRSMDRIAAGDLEHRVPVRGRDEVAVMGRSFNAMAERVHGMVLGQKA